MVKLSRREFGQAHEYHRGYLSKHWAACVNLAEKQIGHRPNEDDLDKNLRTETVLELSKLFFVKNTMEFSDFILTVERPRKRRRA